MFLTTIPRLRLRGHEGESNNCFSKIQLVDKNIDTKQLQLVKAKLYSLFLPPKSRRFSLLVGYNI